MPSLFLYLLYALAAIALGVVLGKHDEHMADKGWQVAKDKGHRDDNEFTNVGRNGKPRKPFVCCNKKGGCAGTVPAHVLEAYVLKGKPCDCKVCGKAYPRKTKPAPKEKANSAQNKEIEKLRKQIKDLESAVSDKNKDPKVEGVPEEPAQAARAEAPKELVAALDHQKASISEFKGLGPILKANFPGGFEQALATAERERKRIVEEIRNSKPLEEQAAAAKAKVDSLEKSWAKAKKGKEQKDADIAKAQKALEAAQQEASKHEAATAAIESELAEAKLRHAAIGEQVKGSEGPTVAEVKAHAAGLNSQERGDYEFLRSIVNQRLLLLSGPTDEHSLRIQSIVAGSTDVAPQVAPQPPDQEMDEATQQYTTEALCKAEADALCSDDEDDEARTKKVDKLTEKLVKRAKAPRTAERAADSTRQTGGVAKTIGKK